ncbi:siroheme synthase [Altererythrobacter sp.]|uniref:siroheme synthase n=1 Tax=Altererythrobacter sp. TaxID=1872480 RepID=UPI001AFDBD5A|nr:siroheme synthase [Altererythrobacter sp.]MBO6608882.1 siroheme synthase [Altererythrobacter sp.]MBO6640922.1 siroheme synthase [Altererythrobacter sp.]MBO6708380.1 siroheme synthase [Altererythrobacter sp.]
MISSLPLFHRIKGQKVLVLGDGDAAEPKKRLVQRAGGIIEDDMQRAIDEGLRLAFVAYDDPRACENAAINLRCAGMLVNVVDMPDLCDFTTPSILDRDPVLIAVGTGGASAGLAKHLRLRLERILPQSLGRLAKALFNVRARLREKFPEGAERRRAIDDALREGGALDPFEIESAERVEKWLSDSSKSKVEPVYDILLSSSDPEDLTLRQSRLLGIADIIVLIGEIPGPILSRARADAKQIDAASFTSPEPGANVVRLIAVNWAT